MKRIASVIVMQARDWRTWLLGSWIVLGATFVICLLIALSIDVLWRGSIPVYGGAVPCLAVVMLAVAIGTVGGTFPFAVGFGIRRSDYLLGTLAWSVAYCASWAILLGLLSLIEASVIKNWGVGLHFFHLPILSDGSPLRQLWVSFVLLLFMYLLGLLLGSIYQRFGCTGEFFFFGIVFLLLNVFVLLSSYWQWWATISGWLVQQTAAALGVWLVPVMAIFALASYALLRKATV